jgi:membrane protease YdiL (CAAX protease family)
LCIAIEQACGAFARDQPPELVLALLAGFATSFAQLLFFRANFLTAIAQRFGPGSS